MHKHLFPYLDYNNRRFQKMKGEKYDDQNY